MFPHWACLGFYATVPFLLLGFVDETYRGGRFRLGSVRALAILVGIVACDAGLVTWFYPRSGPGALAWLAADATIIAATTAVAAPARLTVCGTFALSWILSATAFVIAVFLSDD